MLPSLNWRKCRLYIRENGRHIREDITLTKIEGILSLYVGDGADVINPLVVNETVYYKK